MRYSGCRAKSTGCFALLSWRKRPTRRGDRNCRAVPFFPANPLAGPRVCHNTKQTRIREATPMSQLTSTRRSILRSQDGGLHVAEEASEQVRTAVLAFLDSVAVATGRETYYNTREEQLA